jgi:hypothetical protein
MASVRRFWSARAPLAAAGPLVAACLFATGCARRTEPRLPPNALVSRARALGPFEPSPSPRAERAIAFARAQLGKPYCWGGTGPRCFDCSGLAFAAWRHAGERIPRTSEAIAETLTPVPLEDVRPGDILHRPGHVGLYIGNGWMIDALGARHGVVVRPASDPYRVYRPRGEAAEAPRGEAAEAPRGMRAPTTAREPLRAPPHGPPRRTSRPGAPDA